MGLLDWFYEGGFIMWPLLICSVAIWWVVFEKFWGLAKFTKEFEKLSGQAEGLLKDKKVDEAKGLYLQADPLIGNPHITLFERHSGEDQQSHNERVGRRLVETQLGLKKFMWVLGTIASSAPFIGLFGTVVGIIKSFQTINETGKSGFSVVAGDLSEALVATAAGILVAVIAVMFYNYFQTRINNVNLRFKNKIEDLADLLN